MMRRSFLLLDSPNQTKSVREFYGPEARPDYPRLRSLAEDFGRLVRAEALVNDGLPTHFAKKFERAGYWLVYSHANDCDDRMVARAVAAYGLADTIIVGTGDHMIVGAVKLLKATGHKIVVAAVPQSVSDALIQVADAFLDLPIRYETSASSRQSLSVSHQTRTAAA
jgi:hypothetical protein